jgi:hypothetical protein
MDLILEQERLEKEMVSSGIELFRRRHEAATASDQASRSPVFREMLYAIAEPATIEVRDLLEKISFSTIQNLLKVFPAP